MKKGSSLLCALAVLIGFFWAPGVNAVVPQMINYQGSLTNKTGSPVPDGNYNMEFKIYGVASGGTAFWSEKWDTTTSQITVVGGIFNVMLGFKTPIPVSFFADYPITYLGIKVGTDSEMLPRQKLTSVAYALKSGSGGVPKGGIIMWSGVVSEIPEGWALCDGQEKTAPDGTKVTPPDLRDRFIAGAGSTYAPGSAGGSKTINLSHTHTTGDHVLTIAQIPGHSHGITDPGHNHGITSDNDTDTPWPYGATGNNADGTVYTNSATTGIAINNVVEPFTIMVQPVVS